MVFYAEKLNIMIKSPLVSALSKRESLTLVTIYTLAYGLLFFNGGLFLDDSVTTGFMQKPSDVIGIYKEIGFFLYWPAYLHNFFFSFGDEAGIFLERATIFAAYLASALFLARALRRIIEIAPVERLFIVLLFAVFPMNLSRICISNLNYAISHLLFFAGLSMLASYFDHKKVFFRLTALIAFFISFSANSILVFYIIALLFIVYNERESLAVFSIIPGRVVRYLDFILLPLLFWTVKTAFFVPYGAHKEYYSIKIGRALGVFEKIMRELSMPTFFIENSFFIQVAIVIVIIVMLIFFRRAIRRCFNNRRNDSLLFVASLIILAAALIPYMMVGKFPRPFSYADRHSLLVPLGAAFILYYGVKLLFGSRWLAFVPVLLSVFIILFVSININSFLSFQRQYYKQLSLIENIRSSDTIRENNTFIFIDETKGYNGFPGEVYRQYEWTWLMARAFGDEGRIGWDELTGHAGYCYGVKTFYRLGIFSIEQKRRYLIGDYTPAPPQVIVTVEEGAYSLHKPGNLLRLMAWQLTGALKDGERTRGIIKLGYRKIPKGVDICYEVSDP